MQWHNTIAQILYSSWRSQAMKVYHSRALALSGIFLFLLFGEGTAGVLYRQGFEDGALPVGVADPVWSFPAGVANSYGSGNLFEVVTDTAHSGKYSLRFNYDGRNGFCNTCGGTPRFQHNSFDGAISFVDNETMDLTQDPVFASPDRIVFNVSRGFSKWVITAVQGQNGTNDKLQLQKLADSIDGSDSLINGDDRVIVHRQCGVDGTVGGQVDKRSDCNAAINLMAGVNQSAGQSLYRRIYLRVASGSQLPYNQKLRYWITANGPIYLSSRVDSASGLAHPHVEAYAVGGPGFVATDVLMEFDTWYYYEEEFRAETGEAANDGEYRLWIAKSGDEVDQPVVELTGLDLGPVEKASLWGNHQHSEDSHGFWYLDDLEISDVRIGPAGAPPMPPTETQVKVK
jgi:hypothetical protein